MRGFRGPRRDAGEGAPAPPAADPYREAERNAERRRRLEVLAMIASVLAVAAMVAVFYRLLTN